MAYASIFAPRIVSILNKEHHTHLLVANFSNQSSWMLFWWGGINSFKKHISCFFISLYILSNQEYQDLRGKVTYGSQPSFPWSLCIRCARTETRFSHSCFGGKSESQVHRRRGSCHPSPESQADSSQVLPIPTPQPCPFMHQETTDLSLCHFLAVWGL